MPRASPRQTNIGLTLTAASGNLIPTTTYNDLVTAMVCVNDSNPVREPVTTLPGCGSRAQLQ
jgi:hypothetical protein